MNRDNMNRVIDYLFGKLKGNELKEFDKWVREDVKNKHLLDELESIWLYSSVLQPKRSFDADKAWNSINQKNEKRGQDSKSFNTKMVWRRFQKIAAIFILAFALGGSLVYFMDKSGFRYRDDQMVEIKVPLGSKSSIQLLDGTEVSLNAGSKLRYNEKYGIKDRHVELEGEGYFKVAKMKNKPFVVSTSEIDVVALGTSFNVQAYPEDKFIVTTLVEGVVDIRNNQLDRSNHLYLKPNQKAVYSKISGTISEPGEHLANKSRPNLAKKNPPPMVGKLVVDKDVNPEPIVSWKDNHWVIENKSLEELSILLERRYNVKISFESQEIKNYVFGGKLGDETIEQVLNVIRLTAPIKYEIVLNNIVLSEDKDLKIKYKELLNNEN